MTQEQLLKNLTVPKGKIDVVLDTDACNEIDDQFAISYMLHSEEKLNVLGICAAPFKNARSKSPADGMEKSYNEIVTLLKFDGKESFVDNVYKGSTEYLKDEKELEEQLAKQGLFLLRAKAHSGGTPNAFFTLGTGKATISELTNFSRQFSIMLNTYIPILDCLDILRHQHYSAYFL